jgi:HPt (histidine-containing phosphotransfer) domain-containing protein
LDGDIELFRELAELFMDDSASLIKRIQDSINSSDSNQLRKSAHTLKGSVSNFSAQKAFDAAFNLENIGQNNNLDNAESAFRELKSEIQNLIEAMKLLMNENDL